MEDEQQRPGATEMSPSQLIDLLNEDLAREDYRSTPGIARYPASKSRGSRDDGGTGLEDAGFRRFNSTFKQGFVSGCVKGVKA